MNNLLYFALLKSFQALLCAWICARVFQTDGFCCKSSLRFALCTQIMAGLMFLTCLYIPSLYLLWQFALGLVFFLAVPTYCFHTSRNLSLMFYCFLFTILCMVSIGFTFVFVPVCLPWIHGQSVYILEEISCMLTTLCIPYIWKQVRKRMPVQDDFPAGLFLVPVTNLLLADACLIPRPFGLGTTLTTTFSIAGILLLTLLLSFIIIEIHKSTKWAQDSASARFLASHLSAEYRRLSSQYARIRRQEHDIKNKLTTLEILVSARHLPEAKALAARLSAQLEALRWDSQNEC